MNDLFKTFRLALYVCALPLLATAMVSAHTWVNSNRGNDEPLAFEVIENGPVEFGSLVSDVSPNIAHVLHVDAAGGVSGRVLIHGQDQLFGAAGLDVSLNLAGQVVANAVSDADGVFRFENIAPGSFTLIASSANSVGTFGVYVVADNNMVPQANEVQFNVAVASINLNAVRSILNSEIEPATLTYQPGLEELPIAGNSSRVSLNTDGSLSGRIVPLLWLESTTRFNMTGNNVYLFNAEGLVAESAVDAEGFFRIDSLAPGVYDFASNGPNGAAAISIEVVPSTTVASANEHRMIPASTAAAAATPQPGGGLGIVLSEPTSGPIIIEIVIQNPGGGPTGFGGGFGGGGGIGGLGGIGDWIGAALAIWALSEAFDDNNQQVVVPPVVIPPVISPSS